jgi:predicted RNA-binding protein with PIN domain
MEQSVILGAGAYRISAREWRETIKAAKKERRRKYQARPLGDRSELSARLSDEILAKLEELRRAEIK